MENVDGLGMGKRRRRRSMYCSGDIGQTIGNDAKARWQMEKGWLFTSPKPYAAMANSIQF